MPSDEDTPKPRLIIVRGKPGAGKSTLARRLAAPDALDLPLLSRDALRMGMLETRGSESEALRASMAQRAYSLFFQTIALWLRAGMNLIAEQALPRTRAERSLRSLARRTDMVVLHCDVSDDEAVRRWIGRERRNPRAHPIRLEAALAQMGSGVFPWADFAPYEVGAPSLRVDTTNGYGPDLPAILAFCRGAGDAPAAEQPGAVQRSRPAESA